MVGGDPFDWSTKEWLRGIRGDEGPPSHSHPHHLTMFRGETDNSNCVPADMYPWVTGQHSKSFYTLDNAVGTITQVDTRTFEHAFNSRAPYPTNQRVSSCVVGWMYSLDDHVFPRSWIVCSKGRSKWAQLLKPFFDGIRMHWTIAPLKIGSGAGVFVPQRFFIMIGPRSTTRCSSRCCTMGYLINNLGLQLGLSRLRLSTGFASCQTWWSALFNDVSGWMTRCNVSVACLL